MKVKRFRNCIWLTINTSLYLVQWPGRSSSLKDPRGTQTPWRATPGQEGRDHQEPFEGGGGQEINLHTLFILINHPGKWNTSPWVFSLFILNLNLVLLRLYHQAVFGRKTWLSLKSCTGSTLATEVIVIGASQKGMWCIFSLSLPFLQNN